VTFLFTDIEGSTRMWESFPQAMGGALERHDSILKATIAVNGGVVFASGGDGFAVAFSSANAAVSTALRIQSALDDEGWPVDAFIRVRMGLHTGEAVERDGDYFGPPVNQAARIMALGHGDQVLCSATTATLLSGGGLLTDLGMHRLRDLSAPQRVLRLGPNRFPPLRSPDAVATNLPVVPTGLVSREGEVTEIASRLRFRPWPLTLPPSWPPRAALSPILATG
jgi:class 3 adenylate cyclase